MRVTSILLVALLAIPNLVHADLVGDSVDLTGTGGVSFSPINNPTVGAGTEATMFVLGGIFAAIDIDISNSAITLNENGISLLGGFTLGLGETLTIGDMDWDGQPGSIIGVTLTTGVTNLLSSNVSFTANSVTVDLDGTLWGPGQNALLQLSVSHVPEPSAFLCVGLVAVGCGALRRRK